MKNKLVLLFMLVVLTTGCSVDYELEIGKVTKENTNILIDNANEIESSYLNGFKGQSKYNNFLSNNYEYDYDLSVKDDSAKLYFEYGEVVGLNLSNIIRSCYGQRSIVRDDNYYLINLSDFQCASYNYIDISDINVTVTTAKNFSIVESNALNYTSEKAQYNLSNLNTVYLKLEEKEETKEPTNNTDNTKDDNKDNQISEEEKEKNHNDTMIYLGIGILSFVFVLSIILIISKKRR